MSEKAQSCQEIAIYVNIYFFWNTKLCFFFILIDSGSRYLAKCMFGNIKHGFMDLFELIAKYLLTLKWVDGWGGGGEESIWSPCRFSKNVFFINRVEPWFFLLLLILS